jgi:hypothetical protein
MIVVMVVMTVRAVVISHLNRSRSQIMRITGMGMVRTASQHCV